MLIHEQGAWYEWGKKRHNMLDALGGTLDSDSDVDHPADLGVWYPCTPFFLNCPQASKSVIQKALSPRYEP
jgi:hypothetical protein